MSLEKVQEWSDKIINHDDHAEVTINKEGKLSEIAQGIGGDAEKLAELNPEIKAEDVIHPGQVIKIPIDLVKGEQA